MKELQSIECKRYLTEFEDEVLHVVKFDSTQVIYFWDDAYQMEPYKLGASITTVKEFEEKFNVKL